MRCTISPGKLPVNLSKRDDIRGRCTSSLHLALRPPRIREFSISLSPETPILMYVQNPYTVTDHAPLPRGRSGGTSNTRVVHSGDSTFYSLGIRWFCDQEIFSKSPYHSTMAQRPRNGRRAKEDMNSAKTEASRRHARGSNTGGHQHATTPVSSQILTSRQRPTQLPIAPDDSRPPSWYGGIQNGGADPV